MISNHNTRHNRRISSNKAVFLDLDFSELDHMSVLLIIIPKSPCSPVMVDKSNMHGDSAIPVQMDQIGFAAKVFPPITLTPSSAITPSSRATLYDPKSNFLILFQRFIFCFPPQDIYTSALQSHSLQNLLRAPSQHCSTSPRHYHH